MTYTLRFLPAVEEDAIGGYAWYESKSPGLGIEKNKKAPNNCINLMRNEPAGFFE
jgi:hypothetical protein